MIVGADAATDRDHPRHQRQSLRLATGCKRVYYSAFSPIPDASRALPLSAPPLVREHRLYQADWLMRFYGFDVGEIVDDGEPACCRSTSIRSWPGRCGIATASRSTSTAPAARMLLRVPGFGAQGGRPHHRDAAR